MSGEAVWSGAVLTGGRSTRMGTDKALLPVDGVAMAVRVARVLQAAGASEVRCIGGDEGALKALGLDVVADMHPGEGPLGALVTALSATDRSIVVVAPCDLVAPDPAVASAVLAALVDAPGADAAVPLVGGVRQPLDGAYQRACLPALLRVFADGERSVKRALDAIAIVEVTVIAGAGLADADTPEDLAGAQ
jgi:molybdopterin-guanine dinucleotide biosynthesis protein A